jgi:hypothetical protein
VAGGESDHDLLIELRRDVKHLVKIIEGNGQEGLCTQVDRVDKTLTRHEVYFAIMGVTLTVIAACIVERLLG